MSDIKWSLVDIKRRLTGYDLVISKQGRFSFSSNFSSFLLSNKFLYVTFLKTKFKGKVYFGFKFHQSYVEDSLKIVQLSSKCSNLCFYYKGFLKFILDNVSFNLDKNLGFKLLKDSHDIWYFDLNDR